MPDRMQSKGVALNRLEIRNSPWCNSRLVRIGQPKLRFAPAHSSRIFQGFCVSRETRLRLNRNEQRRKHVPTFDAWEFSPVQHSNRITLLAVFHVKHDKRNGSEDAGAHRYRTRVPLLRRNADA